MATGQTAGWGTGAGTCPCPRHIAHDLLCLQEPRLLYLGLLSATLRRATLAVLARGHELQSRNNNMGKHKWRMFGQKVTMCTLTRNDT